MIAASAKVLMILSVCRSETTSTMWGSTHLARVEVRLPFSHMSSSGDRCVTILHFDPVLFFSFDRHSQIAISSLTST